MSQYDFDTLVDRSGTDCLKWDIKDGELPMWVADMDFPAAPEIREAIEKRAQHGVFGYQIIPDAWYDAYITWWKTRHGLEIQKDWLVFTTGVIPAISSAVRKLTSPAEKVCLMTPVYNTFFNSIVNNGRVPYECPLSYDKESGYSMDFEALEKALSDPQTSLLLLCNPQNPGGKIWNREELARVGELCKQYGVIVFADEIHCDLVAPGLSYTPFASVSETCRQISITAVSPTKTFNLAGIQSAAFFSANPVLRHKLWRQVNTDEVAEPNAFAVDATVAAFTKGAAWLDALREYLQDNKRATVAYLKENLPQLSVVSTDATYLLWIDLSEILKQRAEILEQGADIETQGSDPDGDAAKVPESKDMKKLQVPDARNFVRFLREKTGLFVMYGNVYGKGGDHFLRLNIACPKSMLEDGLKRLKAGVGMYLSSERET